MITGVQDYENPGIRVDAAKAMKGKLTHTPSVYDSPVAAGYDPKRIPGWVARPGGSPAPQRQRWLQLLLQGQRWLRLLHQWQMRFRWLRLFRELEQLHRLL